ncbi:hypothetical protein [Nostoc sp.]
MDAVSLSFILRLPNAQRPDCRGLAKLMCVKSILISHILARCLMTRLARSLFFS